jgi:hypothetical protein
MASLTRCLALLAAGAMTLGACGGADRSEDGREPPSTPVVTDPAPAVDPPPAAPCSGIDARGISLPEQLRLPPAVDALRRELFEAALECDFATLEQRTERAGDEFSYTFGLPNPQGPIAHWREIDERERVLEQLARVLTTPSAVIGSGDQTIYAWPSASRAEVTDADWQLLVERGIADEQQVEQYRRVGSYLGWRVGIQSDGTWLYFISGD